MVLIFVLCSLTLLISDINSLHVIRRSKREPNSVIIRANPYRRGFVSHWNEYFTTDTFGFDIDITTSIPPTHQINAESMLSKTQFQIPPSSMVKEKETGRMKNSQKRRFAEKKNENIRAHKVGFGINISTHRPVTKNHQFKAEGMLPKTQFQIPPSSMMNEKETGRMKNSQKRRFADKKNENIRAHKVGFGINISTHRPVTKNHQFKAEGMLPKTQFQIPPSSMMNEKETGRMKNSQKRRFAEKKNENIRAHKVGFGINISTHRPVTKNHQFKAEGMLPKTQFQIPPSSMMNEKETGRMKNSQKRRFTEKKNENIRAHKVGFGINISTHRPVTKNHQFKAEGMLPKTQFQIPPSSMMNEKETGRMKNSQKRRFTEKKNENIRAHKVGFGINISTHWPVTKNHQFKAEGMLPKTQFQIPPSSMMNEKETGRMKNSQKRRFADKKNENIRAHKVGFGINISTHRPVTKNHQFKTEGMLPKTQFQIPPSSMMNEKETRRMKNSQKRRFAEKKNENIRAHKVGFGINISTQRPTTRHHQFKTEGMLPKTQFQIPPYLMVDEKDTGSMVPSQKHGLTVRKIENFPEDNFGVGIRVPQIPPSRYRQIIDRILLGENTEKELQGDEEFEGKYFWNDQPFDKVESSFGEPEVMKRDFGNFDGFDEEQNISID